LRTALSLRLLSRLNGCPGSGSVSTIEQHVPNKPRTRPCSTNEYTPTTITAAAAATTSAPTTSTATDVFITTSVSSFVVDFSSSDFALKDLVNKLVERVQV